MDTQIFDRIRDLLADQLGISADSITAESTFTDDLGIDSLDMVDMVMTLEDEFDVTIPDDEMETLRTVGDLVNYVEEQS